VKKIGTKITLLTACALLLLLPSSAYAEEVVPLHGQRIRFGGLLGVSMASQSTPAPFGNNIDAGSKAGLAFGVAVTVSLDRASVDTPGFFLDAQSELLYAAKGTNLDRDGETLGAYHLGYIEIPLLARAGYRVNPNLAPYLLFGPELGILLTAELENSRGEFSDTKEGLATTDFGLVFGGGVAIDIAAIKGAINVDARYDLGLTDINDTGANGFVKNRAFFVMLGYQYGAL